MPERGGPTTQSGILYQNTVAALFLGDLCDASARPESERVTEVRVEAPEVVDDIVVTYADGHRLFVHSKEDIAKGDSAWVSVWRDIEQQFFSSNFRRDNPVDCIRLCIGEYRPVHATLRELCKRAVGHMSYDEWWQSLNNKHQVLVESVRALFGPEHGSDEAIHRLFASTEVEIMPLCDLEMYIAQHRMPESNVNSQHLLRILRDRVGGRARYRIPFHAAELRESLEQEDQVLLAIPTDLEVLKDNLKACGALLRQHDNSIQGIHIDRSETMAITEWACEHGSQENLGLILDRAGSGKSAVMHDLMENMEAVGIPVLGIKADRQLSGIDTDGALQEWLRLPEPLLRVLGRLAEVSRVVILIDQVDALSLSLSRDQRSLDYVLDVVARIRLIPNVRIVLSCRTFDYKTSPALRQVKADREWQLGELADTAVADMISQLGGNSENLLPSERELLRTPLHLSLYGKLLVEWRQHGITPRRFRSLQELYNELWELVVAPGSDPSLPQERSRVLAILTEYMNTNQTVSVPQGVLERREYQGLEGATRYLVSQGILEPGTERTTWTFLHQTFFDYCYARWFVSRGRSLADSILTGPQGLFERSQMIQVLAYLRGVNQWQYLRELRCLLDAPNLQPHLRALLVSWLGDLADPTDEEWTEVRRLLLSDSTRPQMLRAMFGKAGWWSFTRREMLNRLDRAGKSMDLDWIPYLSSMADVAQGEVIALIEPYMGRSDTWNARVVRVLESIRDWRTPEAIRLYDRHVRQIARVELRDLYILPLLAKGRPGDLQAVCRLLRYILDSILDTTEEYAAQLPEGLFPQEPISRLLSSLRDDYPLKESLKIISCRDPLLFLEQAIPWIERVVTVSSEQRSHANTFSHDALSRGWYFGVNQFPEHFVKMVRDTLETLVQMDTHAFKRAVERLGQLPFMTCQRLVAVAYAAAPVICNHDALEFLLADTRRFRLGDQDDYDTQKLIQAICPYLSAKEKARLEKAILTYQPKLELNARDRIRYRELLHLRLLGAMSTAQLTTAGRRRFQELERKYGEYRVPEYSVSIVIGQVKSPIPTEAIPRMRHIHWMHAIAKYSGDVKHRDILRGGAEQLARGLGGWAKQYPERAGQLSLQLPLDADARYIGAIARGLSESDASSDLLWDVIRRFRRRAEKGFKRDVAWAVEKRARDGVPDDLMEQWVYAPAQSDEDSWQGAHEEETSDSGDLVRPSDPYFSYLNSVRGASLRALLLSLHFDDTQSSWERQWQLLGWVRREGSRALRAGAIEHLTYLLPLEEEHAVELFEDLLTEQPELRRSAPTHHFIYYALRRHFKRMRPYIQALLHDEHPNRRRAGARLACLSAFTYPEAESLVEEALTGDINQRLGAADVYSANLWQPEVRHKCEAELRRLMNDAEKRVRWEACTCFGKLGDEDFESLRDFIEDFARSRALFVYPQGCVEYVYDRATWDPTWSMRFVRLILENPHDGEERRWGSHVDLLIRLVLRVYKHSVGQARQEALELFNQLVEQFPVQTQTVVAEYERR